MKLKVYTLISDSDHNNIEATPFLCFNDALRNAFQVLHSYMPSADQELREEFVKDMRSQLVIMWGKPYVEWTDDQRYIHFRVCRSLFLDAESIDAKHSVFTELPEKIELDVAYEKCTGCMDSMNLVKIEEKDFQVETLAVTAHLLSSDLTYHEGLENVNQEKQETYFFVGEGAFSLAYELFLSMRDIYYMLVSEFLAKNPDKRVIAEVWLCKADDKHMPRLKADLVHVFDYYKKDYTSHQKLDD